VTVTHRFAAEDLTIDLTPTLNRAGSAFLDHISDAVIIHDRDGRRIYANAAGRADGEGGVPAEAQRLAALVRATGRPAESVTDGWQRWVAPTAEGGLTFIGRRDVRSVQTQAVLDTEARLHQLFEHAPTDLLVLQVHPDGAVLIESANIAFGRTTGLAAGALQGRPVEAALDKVTADILAADARRCAAQGDFDCQHSLAFPVGQLLVRSYYRAMPGTVAGTSRVLLTQIDQTETRRIEAALRQALRLEVVGQLTGGVAHDFNNLLTAILGSLELLGTSVAEDRQLRWVRIATEAAERGATLTRQLLAYARKQFLEPTATDIPEALGGMTELIRGSLGGRIKLATAFEPGTWLAHTDIAQLELALLNLMVNARSAMPGGGDLRMSTHNHPRDADGLPLELESGDYVVVTVADSGAGMAPEVLAHAMEPFFTTKGIGEGSGLGLSQAYGFARQSGGTLQLTSAVGAGTVVEIFLPRAVDTGFLRSAS
jgi:signal transduction histidine kinase